MIPGERGAKEGAPLLLSNDQKIPVQKDPNKTVELK
jgi:hypothetical protein